MQQFELEEHTRLMGEAEAAEQTGEALAARGLYKRAAQHGLAFVQSSAGPETRRVVLGHVRRALAACKQGPRACPVTKEGDVVCSEVPRESWADVLCLERTRERITLSTCLARRQRRLMSSLGGSAEMAFLLYGPPGGGKSTIARAVANELSCPFYEVSSSQVLGMYVGQSEGNARRIFDSAMAHPLSIVFIDEMDGLAPSRQREQNSEASKRLVTELLQCLDRARRSQRVYVFGATNVKSSLDSAVLRRFESRICVPLPGARMRAALLVRALPWLGADPRLADLVARTRGFNASDILGVLNRVKSEPLRRASGALHWLVARDAAGAASYSPCAATDPGAVAMRADEVPEEAMAVPTATFEDVESALASARASVSEEEVERVYAEAGAELLDRE